jgi:exodeoxyribonuclease V alpha subunit
MPESLTGILDRIIFFNEENDYVVGEVVIEGQKLPVVVQGKMPSPLCGETLEMEGEWTSTKYGRQFKVERCKQILPSSIHGIQKFLASGIVKGIGEKMAEKIVKKFGLDVFRVLDEESGRLREIKGLGADRAHALKQSWTEHKQLREAMIFLHGLGLGTSLCQRLIQRYGSPIKEIVEENPYALIGELDRVGFKTVDQIARNAGVPSHSKHRLKAGLEFALLQAEEDGHTALDRQDLLDAGARLLETPPEDLEHPLIELMESGAIVNVGSSPLLQNPRMQKYENSIATNLWKILQGTDQLPLLDSQKAIVWAQERAKISLTLEQSSAVQEALKEKIYILTGGPGTGKTTVLKTLIEILRAKKVSFHLASPTGRAAQRMSEATGMPAQTIHRLLKYNPDTRRWTYNESEPLPTQFLIVDEASMIDTPLLCALLKAVPDHAHLLLVGDADQLPSVGPGEILHDLINSGYFAVGRLQRIFRQNEGLILSTAHSLLQGEKHTPQFKKRIEQFDPKSDLNAFYAPTPESAAEMVVGLCRQIPRALGINPLNDVQVLVPMHKGNAGTINLNTLLQSSLNGHRPGMKFGSTQYMIGDKLLQTRNNYNKMLFNGDIGRVESFDALAGTLTALFGTERVTLERPELTDTALAYAISIHKSQGSEYPCVIIPIIKAHFAMLTRNLLYTAITRGKRQVILVGDPAAYQMAASRVQTNTRETGLKHYLTALQKSV